LAAGSADSAAQAYSEANALLARIDYLPEAERARLETALAELRQTFGKRSQSSGLAAQTVRSADDLTQALPEGASQHSLHLLAKALGVLGG